MNRENANYFILDVCDYVWSHYKTACAACPLYNLWRDECAVSNKKPCYTYYEDGESESEALDIARLENLNSLSGNELVSLVEDACLGLKEVGCKGCPMKDGNRCNIAENGKANYNDLIKYLEVKND